jgi:uncharacterized glyoxalase superfamily protein PhnB
MVAVLVNRSMPEQVLIPVLAYTDIAHACDFLCAAFGFTERWRVVNHRAQPQVSPGAAIAVIQGAPPQGDSRDHVMVRVEDVDAHAKRARAAGAVVLAEPTDMPYGERQYTTRDFSGRTWVFTQTVADVAPADWGATA